MRTAHVLLAAACAALTLPAAAQTTFTTMGRLFTTPAERMALDQQRSSVAVQSAAAPGAGGLPTAAAGAVPMSGPPGQAGSVAAVPPPTPAAPVRLDGVLRRGSGPATIWVDNEARDATVSGRHGAGVPVNVGGRRVLLKPGQSYDPNTGMVVDAQPAR